MDYIRQYLYKKIHRLQEASFKDMSVYSSSTKYSREETFSVVELRQSGRLWHGEHLDVVEAMALIQKVGHISTRSTKSVGILAQGNNDA